MPRTFNAEERFGQDEFLSVLVGFVLVTTLILTGGAALFFSWMGAGFVDRQSVPKILGFGAAVTVVCGFLCWIELGAMEEMARGRAIGYWKSIGAATTLLGVGLWVPFWPLIATGGSALLYPIARLFGWGPRPT